MSDQTENQTTRHPKQDGGKPPIITHWNGPVFAKVWENEGPKGGLYYNVTTGKLYTDRATGETRETMNLQKDDLPRMQFVLGEAYRSINLVQQNVQQNYRPEQVVEQAGNHSEPAQSRWLEVPKAPEKNAENTHNQAIPQIENGHDRSP